MSQDRLHVRRGQPVERGQGRALEIAPGRALLRGGARVRASVGFFERTFATPLRLAPERAALVRHHTQYPGQRRPRRIELRGAQEHADERLLGGVLGATLVAEERAGKRARHRPEQREGRRERRAIAVRQTRQ